MRSRRHYHDDPRRAGQAISEFAAYKAKRVGALTEPGVFEMAESMPSWECIERKMFDLNIDRNLIKWQTEPEESDDEA